jgi:hypothetical protein
MAGASERLCRRQAAPKGLAWEGYAYPAAMQGLGGTVSSGLDAAGPNLPVFSRVPAAMRRNMKARQPMYPTLMKICIQYIATLPHYPSYCLKTTVLASNQFHYNGRDSRILI